MSNNIDVHNIDGLEYLKTIEKNSIDLILTDPPYIISRDTGMNSHYNAVKQNEVDKVEFVKTEGEWDAYKAEHKLADDEKRTYI